MEFSNNEGQLYLLPKLLITKLGNREYFQEKWTITRVP